MITVVMGVMYRPDGRFLIARRPARKMYGGLWEFPGGKLDANESAEQALHREFAEELGCTITIDTRLDAYDHVQNDMSLHFIPFIGRLETDRVQTHEHEQIAFITTAELDAYRFAPPDYEMVRRLKLRQG